MFGRVAFADVACGFADIWFHRHRKDGKQLRQEVCRKLRRQWPQQMKTDEYVSEINHRHVWKQIDAKMGRFVCKIRRVTVWQTETALMTGRFGQNHNFF
ncbi:hypothetical protein L596_012983 [Steinernema carpocapsae]|uniref:Uncharacterized protein n=1 Tax=Steinernema carpocapsae TaxID=34508 RepID=A0A4V6A4Y6_STECR|nr:hypothetical protein L596_012983 [Steinernema carpocapsae]